MKIYTGELLNLSAETMNSVVEDIDLLQDKSNICHRNTEVLL